MAITTHVLDTARGRPAVGVLVRLERQLDRGSWEALGEGQTDADGRQRMLMPAELALLPGVYRLVFDTRHYFESHGLRCFYPHVVVVFETTADEAHYHVPLLLAPFGYSTYRGT